MSKPEFGKMCERCGEWKDVNQMAAFHPEGSDTSDVTQRVSWCFKCIDEDLRLQGKYNDQGHLTKGIGSPILYRWNTGEELAPHQLYYLAHKEERQEYQRRRYWEMRGKVIPPPKRSYTPRNRLTQSSPFVPEGLLEEDKLKKQLLRKQNWVTTCFRDWEQQTSPSGKEAAAAAYHSAVMEVEKLRFTLSLPPQKLKGNAEEDAVFLGEMTETIDNEAETSVGPVMET